MVSETVSNLSSSMCSCVDVCEEMVGSREEGMEFVGAGRVVTCFL